MLGLLNGFYICKFALLRARLNEKEVNVKPTTSLINNKTIRHCAKQKKNIFSEKYLSSFIFTKSLKIIHKNLKKQQFLILQLEKKGKRKVQRVPQSQTAALPRHKEEEETDKSKQTQNKQTYEKHTG